MNVEEVRFKRLGYLVLNVSELSRSRDFYRDIVGLDLVEEADGRVFLRCSDRNHDIVLTQSANPGLKAIGWQMEDMKALACARARFEEIGLATIAISDADAAASHIDGGFRIVEPTMGVTMDFFVEIDPAGKPFEPSQAKIARLGHVVLASADMAASEQFFREQMNFRVSDRIENAVVHMRCFPNPLHHSFGIGNGKSAQLHHINFMVTDYDDIGRANVRMKKHNVPIVFGPGKHPQSESYFFYFLDPDGLTLEYSFGMEEFPEDGARPPRLFPLEVDSVDYWGGMPEQAFAKVGAIESLIS